jgi:hypothetical protein
MTVSRQTKSAWLKKLTSLADGLDRAQEDLLVGIYQAREDGLSQADVAYMVSDRSSSGIAAKAAKGKEILERRKRGPKPS